MTPPPILDELRSVHAFLPPVGARDLSRAEAHLPHPGCSATAARCAPRGRDACVFFAAPSLPRECPAGPNRCQAVPRSRVPIPPAGRFKRCLGDDDPERIRPTSQTVRPARCAVGDADRHDARDLDVIRSRRQGLARPPASHAGRRVGCGVHRFTELHTRTRGQVRQACSARRAKNAPRHQVSRKREGHHEVTIRRSDRPKHGSTWGGGSPAGEHNSDRDCTTCEND
jgi:hypothetical protein